MLWLWSRWSASGLVLVVVRDHNLDHNNDDDDDDNDKEH